MAIIWAIQKCDFYLKGLPNFPVATDHRPLVGTFKKGISGLTNPRLQRLREKVAGYQFTVKYVPGRTHNIADALSRAPIFPGSEDLDIKVDTALAHLVTTSDPALKTIYESINSDYLECIQDSHNETKISQPAQQLKSNKGKISIRDGLFMLDAKIIILLKKAIKPIMERLHIGHAGKEKQNNNASATALLLARNFK